MVMENVFQNRVYLYVNYGVVGIFTLNFFLPYCVILVDCTKNYFHHVDIYLNNFRPLP